MIEQQLTEIRSEMPESVKLVAVSKFHPAETIRIAYNAGQRIFGESKVQELEAKQALLPEDIEWHFIGHLQTNKVKYIAPYISMIHAVDSLKLLSEINKQAQRAGRVIDCLLEIHIAREESKYGFSFNSCREMLKQGLWKNFEGIRICGVMGMATNTDNEAIIRNEFAGLYRYFGQLKNEFFADTDYFKEISMGMSHDYRIAIAEGSTMIRVGSKIFGERNY